MFPLASVPMVTIFIPTIAALAGFVPCADTGIMQTLRWWSPLDYNFHGQPKSEVSQEFIKINPRQ
jgi:hypothetical protein